ncbi:MAG TPA: hypothetical protein VJ825_11455 [Gemmatimonadaceae bacterium]|nr:hypothetical protein [Gemmatimonadaceae bacterium]
MMGQRRRRARIWIAWSISIASVACDAAADDPGLIDARAAEGLVGVWDAKLSLASPYQLGPESTEASEICGTIGFVEDHRRGDRYESAGGTSLIGVYDLNLRRLGLDWLGGNPVPTAFASGESSARLQAPSQPDSVRIVLSMGNEERIVLLGRRGARGIDGTWLAQSARGTATGAFSMRPHGEGAPTSCVR